MTLTFWKSIAAFIGLIAFELAFTVLAHAEPAHKLPVPSCAFGVSHTPIATVTVLKDRPVVAVVCIYDNAANNATAYSVSFTVPFFPYPDNNATRQFVCQVYPALDPAGDMITQCSIELGGSLAGADGVWNISITALKPAYSVEYQ